tara:strand:- start:395 stop:937 length:543 start_codon:yes stop_codon:yes gene_type:complete
MTIEFEELCPTTQQQVAELLSNENDSDESTSNAETDSDISFQDNDTEAESNTETLNTVTQIEEVLGSSRTLDSVTSVLAGEELTSDALIELSDSYGVSLEQAQSEIESVTEELYEAFQTYATSELGISDTEHLAQWVAYVANKDLKIKQLYQQAVIGGLSGDFSLAEDLVQEYKKFYRVF